MSVTTPREAPVRTDHVASATSAGLAGAVAVAVALATVELAAGLSSRVPSAVDAVGQQVIPLVPGATTRWAIAAFGAANVAVLNAGTTLLALTIGAATGIAARRGFGRAVAVFVGFGTLGIVASSAWVSASLPVVLTVTVVAVGLALWLLHALLARLHGGAARRAAAAARDGDAAPAAVERRRFLRVVGAAAVAAAVAATTGRFVLRRELTVVDPADVALPPAARALPDRAGEIGLDVPGLAPLVTPNDDFFVIDTAVVPPVIDPAGWTLRIHGAVEREVLLTYDDLLALPLEEVDVTLSCVSNEVGGGLVGTARWLGVRLRDLLARAGVREDGVQVLARSADGFTAGFPTAVLDDGRDAVLAVGMNGSPLPIRHGFPARLVVPGLYGYVAATKWLTELELTSWDVDGYWIPRGWAKEGPVKTQSRIDVPRPGGPVAAGEVVVAGVAWAPTRGIERVEVRLDGGAWRPAELGPPLASGTWVQWRAVVPTAPGDHVVQVRATDGSGAVQPEGPRPPAPDGAEGWHRVTFRAA